ncbi:MAG: hypothetical protein ABEH43_06415 [Flavobacteriales bacterium]
MFTELNKKIRVHHLVILLLLFAIGNSYCQDKNNENSYSTPYKLKIFDQNYAGAYTIQYIITSKNIKIIFKSGLKGDKDSTLYFNDINPNKKFKNLSYLNIDSLNSEYRNPCILDGSQITVFIKKGNKSKSIHLSNYYQKDIGTTINMINDLIPEKYSIQYDKKELIQRQKNCGEQMIIKD